MALDINAIVAAAKAKATGTTTTSSAITTPVAPRTVDIRTVDAESLKTKAGSGC